VKSASNSTMKGFLSYTEDPIVLRHRDRPALLHLRLGLTTVIGNQVKVVGWYDNEWGYSNRLVDLVALLRASL
jgi:glyceraldehyde 3-phosphate dehydrogenase